MRPIELGGAVVLVPPDAVSGYFDAIESLIDEPGRYDEVVRAGEIVRSRFYDVEFPDLKTRRDETARAAASR